MRPLLHLGVLLLAAAPAVGAEPGVSPQARGIDGAFLEHLPVPPLAGRVCVVDRGASLTPDTEPLIEDRLPVDPAGPLDGVGNDHGNLVVGVLGAPRNGWGGVGLWPRVRVVSVAVPDTATGGDLARAVVRCLPSHPLVVSLSLSDDTGSAALRSAVALARAQGASVVAAAGNSGGDPLLPASLPGVLAVSASDAVSGRLCSFSARSAVALSAPGCGVAAAGTDGVIATRAGTSLAAPQASAVLAALRAYAPHLDADSAESLLRATARVVNPGEPPIIDAAAAFRAADLSLLAGDSPTTHVPATAATAWRVSPRARRPGLVARRLAGGALMVRLGVPPGGRIVWGGRGPVSRVGRSVLRIGLRARPRRIWLVATSPALRPSVRRWLAVPAVSATRAPGAPR